MNQESMALIAQRVQEYAEDVHCASAIFAVEKIIQDEFNKDLSTQMKSLYSDLEDAFKGKQNNVLELFDRKRQLEESMNNKKYRIRIVFDNLSENSARYTISDTDITIVLPAKTQNLIKEGLADNSKAWTNSMIDAKRNLRVLTAHELGHIITTVLKLKVATEDEIKIFSQKLVNLRKNRPS